MKKSEMVCKNCCKFDGTCCRLNPIPMHIHGRPVFTEYALGTMNPETHSCAQGQWINRAYKNSDGNFYPVWFKWADWETNEKGEPL